MGSKNEITNIVAKKITDIRSQHEAECLFLDWLGNFGVVDDVEALLKMVEDSNVELPPDVADQLGVETLGQAASAPSHLRIRV